AHLLEHWPERRRQTLNKIAQGHARFRTHGDVDDIGYRKLVNDQEKDISIGEQALRQMANSRLMPVEVQDPVVRKYIEDLAAKIATNSDLKIPLHTMVLDSSDIDAIGLPGGFLILTSALVVACENEAELAGVISQQIAHVAAR